MLNFETVEKMANEVVGLDHFMEISKSSVETRELKNKVFIKTNYLGLTTKLFISKEMENADDNTNMEFIMDYIRYCESGSSISVKTKIGSITFEIGDDLTIYVDHKKFNAVMEFVNIKAKNLFFGIKDFTESKISKDDLQELINAYYYSIK